MCDPPHAAEVANILFAILAFLDSRPIMHIWFTNPVSAHLILSFFHICPFFPVALLWFNLWLINYCKEFVTIVALILKHIFLTLPQCK